MHQMFNGQQKYYFSDKLKAKFSRISQYLLTVIEAPGGFGKTTAVREYLRNEHPQAVCGWYTCLGEPASAAWMGICELFAEIDRKVADDLKNLKTPAMDTLGYIKAALKNLSCQREIYLVVDNYQLIRFNLHRELIHAFSMHEDPKLHMIFITHQIDSRQQLFLRSGRIHTIDALPFFFDREGIAGLFRMEGLRLTEEELEYIFKRTEGWISAIRLQMLHYRETGSFTGAAGIEQLVETAIWNRLPPEEQEFMLAVSVFDSFTAPKAKHMLDSDALPGKIEEGLRTSEFIRFLPDKQLFIIHSILLDYLRNKFYYHQPKEYQDRLFRRAGLACAVLGEYCPAAKFFYQVGDFEEILSLPFTRQYLDAQKEACEDHLLMSVVRECPDEVLCRYPSTMVVFAHHALLNGAYEIYEKLCGLLQALIHGEGELGQGERRRITGEVVLLETLGSFNDLTRMRKGYEAASEIWGESPDIIENSTPWFSVFLTTFGMFWRESGTLDGLLDIIDELKPIYRVFSRGQGAGLSDLMRGEVMLNRGEDEEAEILCRQAICEARINGQTSICIYAELCLARIFILRGDTERFLASFKGIQGYGGEGSDLTTRRMVDVCLSILSLQLGVKDYVAPWLYDIESIRRSLYVPVIPFAETLHFRLLLMDKRYNELYALTQLALDGLEGSYANIKCRMPQLYYFIFLAVAKQNTGDRQEARKYVKAALDVALPDRVYIPFAEHECMLELLSGLNMRQWNKENSSSGAWQGGDSLTDGEKGSVHPGGARGDSFSALRSLCRRERNGVRVIKKALFRDQSPLTPREREIALLAQKRLSAREIAAELYISEKTVKSTLGRVYDKLDIHSRSELDFVEF